MCAVLLYVRDMQKWTTREQEISREMKEQEISRDLMRGRLGVFRNACWTELGARAFASSLTRDHRVSRTLFSVALVGSRSLSPLANARSCPLRGKRRVAFRLCGVRRRFRELCRRAVNP